MAAMWPETEKLADEGLVAFACTSYTSLLLLLQGLLNHYLAQTQFRFAWPRKNNTPVVYDMATASMAMGEVQVAKARRDTKFHLGTGLNKRWQRYN